MLKKFLHLKFLLQKKVFSKFRKESIDYFSMMFEGTSKLNDIDSHVRYEENKKIASDLKLITFYLPQFHPLSINDEVWEKGFTEWTNVTKAIPQYVGHYQPKLPIDLGFYDLRLVENMRRQVGLAKNYGIYGFCFHHYWFNGRGIMRTPIDNFLNNKDIDFKFCINWANENWSRKWDGKDNDIILKQEYSDSDYIAFAKDTAKYLLDSRYIKVNDKPLLMIYNISSFPDPRKFIKVIRHEFRSIGVGEIYIIATKSLAPVDHSLDIDADVEFAPNQFGVERCNHKISLINNNYDGKVYDYIELIQRSKSFEYGQNQKITYRSICPSWDNEARLPGAGVSFINASPEKYAEWLEYLVSYTKQNLPQNNQFIFINAWNEWAEGAYLEPDRKFGYAYLSATYQVLSGYK